jgi:hypothetical protein
VDSKKESKRAENLFKNLTKLFKSGPVVRRKIRQLDTVVAGPDKSMSSAAMLFNKSVSPTYANITSNAYNLAERLTRYQDYCFTGDTLVFVVASATGSNFQAMRIDEICARWSVGDKSLHVSSYDHENGQMQLAPITGAMFTGEREIVKVTLDDGTEIKCTENHRFMLLDGSYCEAEKLVSGTELKSAWIFRSSEVVKSVEKLNVIEKVYDIEVAKYHNFALVKKEVHGIRGTVFVHNCVMEQTPEICAAMDIYADEVVAQSDKGQSLHIFSENEKIQEVLDELFYDTLNVEFNLRAWTRNLIKYGDLFLFQDVHPDQGVINVFPIPVNEIEREDGYDPEDPFATRFRWVTLGNRVLENWEIAHFRLLGNDLFLPYGCSMVEAARRIWRQLILIEDAMLVYRITRAPDRRVFYIDVGNIPADQVEGYMQQQKMKLRSNQVIDDTTSRVDLRYNPLSVDEDFLIPVRGRDSGTKIDTLAGGQNTGTVEDVAYIQKKLFAALKVPRAYLSYDEGLTSKACLVGNTKIPLLDGRTLTMKELADEYEKNPESKLYAYSTDLQGNFKPGKINKAWMTKKVKELREITLDNGEIIECTDNHPFLCRDGVYKRADQLEIGQSLMPLYRKYSSKEKGDLIEGYDMIHQNGEWIYTHKAVYDDVCKGNYRVQKQRVIHHVDCKKLNNNPENLQEMDWYSHRKWHANNLSSTLHRPDVIAKREPVRLAALAGEKHRQQKSVQMKEQHADKSSKMQEWVHSEELSKSMSKQMTDRWKNPEYRALKKKQNSDVWKNPEYYEKHSGDNHWSRKKYVEAGYNIDWLISFCKEHNITSIKQWGKSHKQTIVNICPFGMGYVNVLIEKAGYIDWRDFASRALGIVVPNTGRKRGETKKDEFHNHKIINIRVITLDEAVPVYDLEVETWHNFLLNSGTVVHNSLSQEDIRFSRTVNVIQRVILSELNKIAIVHLYANGFTDEDLINFTLRLSNPSTVAQQQKLELWRTKFEIAGSMPENMGSKRFAYKEVWGLSDDQISEIERDRKRDRVGDAKLDAIADDAAPGHGGGGGGGAALGGAGGADVPDDIFADLGDDIADAGGDVPGGDDGGAEEGDIDSGDDGAEEEEEAADEEEPGQDLLLSGDDNAPGEDEFIIPEIDKKPFKPLDRVKYNRSRRRHHGASTTFMPDLNAMTSNTDDEDGINDPYDRNFMRSVGKYENPLTEGRSQQLNEEKLCEVSVAPRLGKYLTSTLSRMDEVLSRTKTSSMKTGQTGMLVEGIDIQDEIDAHRPPGADAMFASPLILDIDIDEE